MTPAPSPSVAARTFFRPAALDFLRRLRKNNRREWFESHKADFDQELKQPMLAVIESINRGMEKFAPAHVRPPQKCMMRIYRDIRFSSDKRPYKTHVSAWWSREGLEKTSGGGYYMHVSADEVLVAAGVYMPEKEQLKAIRNYLLEHHAEVRRLLHRPALRRRMNTFTGMPLTRAPKGFPKEHPAMDLLLCRQWGVEAHLDPSCALDENFSREILQYFRSAAPLVDALNRPLLAATQQTRRPLFGFAVAKNRRPAEESS
jgi:uncharacterized protein (TIGR02453 family)